MNGEPVLVKVSGARAEAMRVNAERLASFVEDNTERSPGEIAWAADVGRADLGERAAVVAEDMTELAAGLRAIADETDRPGVIRGRRVGGPAPKIAFLAPGHGISAAGLLAGVYGNVPVITDVLDSLDEVLGPPTRPPLSVLLDAGPEAEAALARTEIAQPALYALALALGEWWRSLGVEPYLVAGHSVGAYAAAALAGVFSPQDGARLIADRGRLMGDLPEGGAMAVVTASPQDVEGLNRVAAGDVTIAVRNGPRNLVLSGPEAALDEVTSELASRNVRVRRLPVSRAFHSSLMDPVLEPLGAAFEGIELRPPSRGFVSDTTGTVAGAEVATAGYWVRHTREPVMFSEVVATLAERNVTTLIELGPGDLLPLAAGRLRCVPTVSRRRGPRRGMLTALGEMWAGGADVDWTAVHPRPERHVRLPTYAFQRGTSGEAARPAAGTTTSARPSAEKVDDLVDLLRRRLVGVMGLEGPEELDADAGLFDLGLTSAMVVELRVALERDLGREIPATAVFNHPTIHRFAEFLAGGAAALPLARPASTSASEPIAIVGMACRFPGGANDPAAFWRLLTEGREGIGDVPADRWDGLAFHDPDPAAPGRAVTMRGGFLDVPVDRFEADAFGISPREALGMDPQQRLLLEVATEALDDAGYAAASVEDTATGVYVGINTSDYMQLLAADESADIDSYVATGNTFSVAAGRLSYRLGLRGPSIAVDTACSSSLVAAHLAVRGLRSGETELALVGGVNLMLSPGTTIGLSKMGALAPDGRCKTFDAAADGYVRGEGCGVVVLKRLSDARADGDRIWAVLRGTAVNQDGRSAALTAPNGQAQEEVIAGALRDAGLDGSAVGYVEAHGTGTPLGDPIELRALSAALRGKESSAAPVVVGSVKTNVGHLEAAAGVCGLIKVALMLHHGQVPAHLNMTDPNRHVDWDDLAVTVPTELTPWDEARVAGLSSFGFSGTNAHTILERAPATDDAAESDEPRAELLLVSAHTPGGLSATLDAYETFLRADAPEATWAEIARTAALHRGHLAERAAVVARSPKEAADRLVAARGGRRPAGVRIGRVRPQDAPPRLVFVYSGQASQWAGMGRSLLADPTAGEVLARCDAAVRELAGWSLLDELTAERPASRLDDTRYAQPAIFAVQSALTELWRSWGVRPDAVLGHSVGEIAAAHAAGALDLDTALRIVVRRGEVMAATRGAGAMAVAGLPEAEVSKIMGDRLTVAAVNSPVSTVVAGALDDLAELEPLIRERGGYWNVFSRDYAFHSPAMHSVSGELADALGEIAPVAAAIPLLSTVTGGAAEGEALTTPYWVDNMVRPVRFHDTLLAAAGESRVTIVEVGPHAVLTTAMTQSLGDHEPAILSSMRAGRDARESMLDAAGGLHLAGHGLDFPRTHGAPGRRATLPVRRWSGERYWLPARPVPAGSAPAEEGLERDLYEIEWRPGDRPEPSGASGTWLLLADRQGVAERVADGLAAAGCDCRVLEPADDVLRAALAEEPVVRGVIHLGCLDAASAEPGPELDRGLEASCGPLLFAPEMLAGHAKARLWVVTRGAVAVADAPQCLAQAPAWGLGRVVALEFPEIWGGMLDLDPEVRDVDAHAELIVAEVLGADDEDQIAYRRGERRLARLVQTAPPAAAPLPIDAEGAYLITGGRGALGLRIAAWLAEHGARHLVLLGRRPVPENAVQGRDADLLAALRGLREAGVEVHTPSADVADARAMAEALDGPWPAIRGVVHAAGVFQPCALKDMGWEHFRDVLRSKVEGTLVLDAITDELDFFVMFSSASSVWGSALAGHYVAANHFEDAMAHDRVRRDLPGLAVNWGWWSDSDMAAHHEQYFESMGLHELSDREAFAAFGRLLGSDRAQVTVAPVDWTRFRAVMEAKRSRPLLELMGDSGDAETAVDRRLLEEIERAPTPAARRDIVANMVQDEVASVLGRPSGTRMDPDIGFFEVGMDSIMSVELRGRLESALGVRLAATAAFEHPSVAALTGHLLEDVLQLADPTAADGDEIDSELAELSEEELLRLLEKELEDRHEHD